MARYKVIINTDSYQHKPCSKKNWEAGTMNDFMVAINGWHTTEHNLREVNWRLRTFQGNSWLSTEWDPEKNNYSDPFLTWRNKKCNTITYYDRLCEMERTHEVTPYGWKQGYFDIDDVIMELREKGVVKIPFSYVYDIRQYDKRMDGCYMEIKKVK